jgi:hypothetical protein
MLAAEKRPKKSDETRKANMLTIRRKPETIRRRPRPENTKIRNKENPPII